MLLRAISLPTHGALELAAGLTVAIGPIALGLSPAGVVASVFVGAVMIGLALAASAPRGADALAVAAHATYDKLLVALLAATAAGAAIAGSVPAMAFFAGAAALYALLVTATRYTARDG
jgi:hypothetical protein